MGWFTGYPAWGILIKMSRVSRVVLIDGANLAYRAQYTHMGLTTAKGKPTGVIFAVLRMLNTIYTKFERCPVLLFWEGGTLKVEDGKSKIIDFGIPNWRKALQTKKKYKGNREITKERIDVYAQLPHVQEVLNVLRYPQFSVPGLEGDDLIGIATRRLKKKLDLDEIAIVSSDRDFFQLIDDVVSVYRPGKGTMLKYTPKLVLREHRVHPHEWAVFKAFVGDSTDNYDGIDGIGPVKAARMVQLGADPTLPWNEQRKEFRVEFKSIKDQWSQAMDCYKLSLIPRSTKHKLFSEESKVVATELFRGMENRIHREFTKRELKEATQVFARFCGKWEMLEILSEKRKFFTGVSCDGEIVV